MLALTKNTVGNVYALLSHYCGRDLQDRPVIPFGGHVHAAKCDESQFKHKSKVRKLRICTIGHRYQAVPILQTVIRVTVYNDCQKAHQMKSVTDHTEIIKGVRLIPIKFSL